jgi:replication factor C small subunit
MSGDGNPMHGTEWSEERREKIVEKLSDGRFAGENNPNYGGEFHGISIWEMDETAIEEFRNKICERRSGVSWEEWVVDADPEAVKEDIGRACAEWWVSMDDAERERIIEKATENCDYPVCDISGDNNPMRDPEVAQKVSEALQGHEPTGGNIRHSDELGHLVRSDWEYEVAKALQDAGVEYQYEPAFELSDSVFHPDFLVGDTVIEVKGVTALWGQTEKVEEFLETYGDEYTFVVVGDEDPQNAVVLLLVDAVGFDRRRLELEDVTAFGAVVDERDVLPARCLDSGVFRRCLPLIRLMSHVLKSFIVEPANNRLRVVGRRVVHDD